MVISVNKHKTHTAVNTPSSHATPSLPPPRKHRSAVDGKQRAQLKHRPETQEHVLLFLPHKTTENSAHIQQRQLNRLSIPQRPLISNRNGTICRQSHRRLLHIEFPSRPSSGRKHGKQGAKRLSCPCFASDAEFLSRRDLLRPTARAFHPLTQPCSCVCGRGRGRGGLTGDTHRRQTPKNTINTSRLKMGNAQALYRV